MTIKENQNLFSNTLHESLPPEIKYLHFNRVLSLEILHELRGLKYIKNVRRGRPPIDCGPAIMFELSNGSYNGRLLDPPQGQGKSHNLKSPSNKGYKGLYHSLREIELNQLLFIQEGIIDELSVRMAGFQSISILSANHISVDYSSLKGLSLALIALDNDQVGEKYFEEHVCLLQKFGISVAHFRWPEGLDANKILLTKGLDYLGDFIVDGIQHAEDLPILSKSNGDDKGKRGVFLEDRKTEIPSLSIVLSYYNVQTSDRHIHCPFPDHIDNHPSFRVDGETYICTCGAGNAFEFIARIESIISRENRLRYDSEAFKRTLPITRRITGQILPESKSKIEISEDYKQEKKFYDPIKTPKLPIIFEDECIQNYLRKVSVSRNVDYDSTVLSAMSHIPLALGGMKRVKFNEDWKEKSQTWIAFVAESGESKTNLFRATGGEILSKWQDSIFGIYAAELEKWKRLSKKNKEMISQPTPKDRVYTSNCTIESLLKRNSEYPGGVSIMCDELTLLLNSQGQYKSAKNSDQQVLLSTWNGHSMTTDLVTELRHISNPCISIVGNIQPDLLPLVISGNNIIDGFSSRFQFVFMNPSDVVLNHRERYSYDKINLQDSTKFSKVLNRLLEDRFNRKEFYFSTASEKRMCDLHDEIEARILELPTELRSSLRKLKTYSLRHALTLHNINDYQSLEINEHTIEKTSQLIRYFIYTAEKAFGYVFQSEMDKAKAKIIEKVRREKKIKIRSIQRAFQNSIGYKKCSDIIKELIRMQYLIGENGMISLGNKFI